MKKMLIMLLMLCSIGATAQTPELFVPIRTSHLRVPSVPLITHDTYLSLWSPYDNLYEGPTEHWTSTPKPIVAALRVDGESYRVMGMPYNVILPMANEGSWTGKYVTTQPAAGWEQVDYDDSAWKTGRGAFGGGDGAYKHIGTEWSGKDATIWVRRSFNMDEVDPNAEYTIIYKHDDIFELYLNGEKLADTGFTWNVNGVVKRIPASLLRKGQNVISAHCVNQAGGAYVDFGLYDAAIKKTAVQKSCQVLATSTYYTFQCGGVDLDLVFTSPQLVDDLMMLSTPINYVSYQVRANDGKSHNVEFYFETTAELTVNNTAQETTTTRTKAGDYVYTKAGTISQPVLATTGDGTCIDWGYLYMMTSGNTQTNISINTEKMQLAAFVDNGKLATTKSSQTQAGGTYPAMSYLHAFTDVTDAQSGFLLVAYDDVYAMNYMETNYKAYWANNPSGRSTITTMLKKYAMEYADIMNRAREMDRRIYDDGKESGGEKYAEILSASYRQVMAAHKLFVDSKKNLLWFSKENNSGGFVNTLDITYPSAPLFFVYNPELVRGMMTSMFDYSASGKWTKNFAAHDLGSYPRANGQTYGGDMPVEESGNMVVLSAVLAKVTGNMDYVNKYWKQLTEWTDYLVEYGKDPANQLCTDDFMGHSSRNMNLAMKAIMGVLSYAELADMLGKNEVAEDYRSKAKVMSDYWIRTGCIRTGKSAHSRLNFGGDTNSWSSKYNMVWDMMWGWDVFATERKNDMAYYQTKMLKYGLPLDSRGNYNKNDWHFWVGAMSETDEEFQTYVTPMWNYINETPTRVPLSDYHNATTGERQGYKARPVIAGYWMKVMMDKYRNGILNGISNITVENKPNVSHSGIYDLQGHSLNAPQKGINIIDGHKVVVK